MGRRLSISCNSGITLCLVCQQTVSAAKLHNIKCQYTSLHKEKFEKYKEKEKKEQLAKSLEQVEKASGSFVSS